MKYLINISGDIPHAGITNINIPLNGRNLIITGKNGSGKTSFLKKLNEKLSLHFSKQIQKQQTHEQEVNYYQNQLKIHPQGSYKHSQAKQQLNYFQNEINKIKDALNLEIINELDLLNLYDNYKAIYQSFEAMRKSNIQPVTSSTSIEQEKENAKNNKLSNLGNKLEQHLVNIRVNKAFAFEKKDEHRFNILNNWFDQFDVQLKFLFENNTAKLVFNDQNFKFKIQLNEREVEFQNLSSGYQAIFDIFADLLVRSEFFEISPLELRGIVLIDEIDAHLHISLQKKILPFFTNLFPQVQFIVSTHSPFVITSTDNDTVVYDISSGEFFEEDLSRYSYESVIKGLFHVNPISSDTKNSIEILKNLLTDNPRNYVEIRSVVKNLVELEKNDLLDKSLKNIYLQAINLLADNNQLEDLDV
ncbi:AAA family ATPase [Acinetobacter sp. YH16032]|uniref:AAA family ATPase n=1 Tax=Acinetobacter sp. YH16032 TaxID=2601181 RepID=UPI0015D17D86|nr:AAA family ATPase [Acinetobacter sp. YH16032]